MSRVNTEKIDTWISKDLLILLEAYMEKADRNKADAIRILLKKGLETENGLNQITNDIQIYGD
jgi:hypothetical protein